MKGKGKRGKKCWEDRGGKKIGRGRYLSKLLKRRMRVRKREMQRVKEKVREMKINENI